MATLTFAYNHARDPMNPLDLGSKIAVALALSTQPVVEITGANPPPTFAPNSLIVTHPNVTTGNTAAIQAVINAYVLDPNWTGGVEGNLRAKIPTGIATNIAALAQPDPTGANNAYIASPALVAGASPAQVQAYVRLMDAQLRALTNQMSIVMAQVRALTRQNTNAMRLLGNALDSTDGT